MNFVAADVNCLSETVLGSSNTARIRFVFACLSIRYGIVTDTRILLLWFPGSSLPGAGWDFLNKADRIVDPDDFLRAAYFLEGITDSAALPPSQEEPEGLISCRSRSFCRVQYKQQPNGVAEGESDIQIICRQVRKVLEAVIQGRVTISGNIELN